MFNSERDIFEQAIFNHYSTIKAAGWHSPHEGDLTRESLFWLQPNGLYGVTNLNAAWWAWQARAGWTESDVRMPPLETPVLCVHQGEHCVLELRRDDPSFEDTYNSFTYWDDPANDGRDIVYEHVTHWQHLPTVPAKIK